MHFSIFLLQLSVIHSLRPCSFASPDFPGYAVFSSIICDTFYLVFTKCSHILLYYISVKCPLIFQNISCHTKYLADLLIFFLPICILYILLISPHAFIFQTLLELLPVSFCLFWCFMPQLFFVQFSDFFQIQIKSICQKCIPQFFFVFFHTASPVLFYPTLCYFSILYRLFAILISKRRAFT